jgi:enamine deaminase RidA (YjgF/YER057c/UK114 family)
MAKQWKLQRISKPKAQNGPAHCWSLILGVLDLGFIPFLHHCLTYSLHVSQKQPKHLLMSAEKRIQELKLELPPVPARGGIYKPLVITGNLAYVSGHGPVRSDGSKICGRVGQDLDIAAGQLAARQTGLAILSTVRHELGSLDRIKRVIKTLGMVNATPDFAEHPKVINGYSELYEQIWGPDDGVGARSAVGMGSLPGNIAVEIEVIFELHN